MSSHETRQRTDLKATKKRDRSLSSLRGMSLLALIPLLFCMTYSDISRASSEAATTLYNLGNDHYANEEYVKAIEAYREALHSGAEHYAIYYNLGNAYMKTDDLGRAVLSYERALRLNPHDEDLLFNHGYATGLVRGGIETPELGWFHGVLKTFYSRFSPNQALFAASTFYVLFWIGIILRAFFGGWVREIVLYLLVITIVFFLSFTGLSYAKIHEEVLKHSGVVLDDSVEVRSGPGEENTVLFTLYEGIKFNVRNRRGGWHQITLTNGLSGWIPGKTFETL